MKKLKLLIAIPLLIAYTTSHGQDSTLTERNMNLYASKPGNTKFMLTGVGWFGYQGILNSNDKSEVTSNFNSYGFSPIFLWKLSDKMFFEGEIEINNGEMELEYAKMSYSINKYLTIGAGRMLTPFGAYAERWEPLRVEKFPNSPLLPNDELLPDDSHLYWGAIMGIDARGSFPLGSAKMNYAVYISNGPLLSKDENGNPTGVIQYENLLDENNNNKEIGGRLGLIPISNSSLEVGISYKHGIAGDQNNADYGTVGASAYAIDLSYVKGIDALKSTIFLKGQYNSLMVGDANYYLSDSTTYTFDNKMQNYFVQFSIRPTMSSNKCLKKTELLFRYNSQTSPKDAAWGAKDANGVGGSVTRTDIGLTYWLSWKASIRLAYETEKMPDATKLDVFLASIVYGF